jgi:hypothetical protein
MNTLDSVLSEQAKIIHIEGSPLVVGITWNQFTETLSNTKKIISKKSPSESGIIIETPIVTQVAFLPNQFDGMHVAAKPIIDFVLSENNVSSLWVFYASADISDGSVWCIIGDSDGVLQDSVERFLSEDELFELLDEHILVTDNKLNVFTDNSSYIDHFEDLSSLIVTQIDFQDDSFFEPGIIKKLSDRKVFGLPPVLFHTTLLFITATLMIQLGARIIEAPFYDMNEPPREVSNEINEHPDWNLLQGIYSSTQSIDSFKNNITGNSNLLEIPPNNVYGWDLKDIKTINDSLSFNLVLNSTASSIGFLKDYLFTNTFPNELAQSLKPNISLNADHKAMNVSFSFPRSENVFNDLSFSQYKSSMKRPDVLQKINSANAIMNSIKKINDKGSEYELKYMDIGKTSLVIAFLMGNIRSDQDSIDELYDEINSLNIEHKKLLAYINDLPKPDLDLLGSVLYSSDPTFLFSLSQETHLFNIKYNEDENKYYVVFSVDFTAENTDDLLDILNKFKTKFNIPLRIKSTNYNWMTSKWSLTGEIYAPKTKTN